LRTCPTFSQWMYLFTFPPTMYKTSNFFPSSMSYLSAEVHLPVEYSWSWGEETFCNLRSRGPG
jgi:hypothetical protein